jgi:hypothetical protein
MWFYVTAATEHGRRVNISKARGDQSSYLMDAEIVYANWHGRTPPTVLGRNRMPVYAGFLALFYDPAISDPQFFEIGKRANIYLSLALLIVLGVVAWRLLPANAAINLTGIAAFGWFIFKAGYTQSELLFYTLFFLAFLACWQVLRTPASARLLWRSAAAGGLCALAYLTKASLPPFIALFGLTFAAQSIATPPTLSGDRPRRRSALTWAVAAGLLFALAFAAIAFPYLSTNKRVFGHYFYNVNSTFYVWYDDWASATNGTRKYGDRQSWPDLPASELPSAARYWHEHSFPQMGHRLLEGMNNIAVVSYRTYDYLAYLLLYTAMLAMLILTRWALFARMVRDHVWLSFFLAAYGLLYLFATAFYFPISGTGTARFFLMHLLPYFFVLSHVFSRSRMSTTVWSAGSLTFTLSSFQRLVSVWLLLDIAFRTWPRLMSTYGGF